MQSRLARAAVIGSGVAAVCVITAASALAHAAPFSVTAGSAPAKTKVAFTATSGTVSFTDTTTGTPLSCTSAVIPGSITVNAKATGVKIATVTGSKAKFAGCTGPAGLKFTVKGSGVWNLNITDSTNGVSTGTISNVRAHVVSTAGPTCAFDVGANTGSFTSPKTASIDPGTVNGTYTNSTQALAVPASNPGSLGLWNVKGSGGTTYCISPSILAQSNKASFSASFKIVATTAADNPIAIN